MLDLGVVEWLFGFCCRCCFDFLLSTFLLCLFVVVVVLFFVVVVFIFFRSNQAFRIIGPHSPSNA